MVKIEGISVGELHIKLKKRKVEQLVKDVFGEDFSISESTNNLFVREKSNLINLLKMSPNSSFLNIYLFLNENEFELTDSKYFDKTIELVKEYESRFGCEATIKTDYSKRQN